LANIKKHCCQDLLPGVPNSAFVLVLLVLALSTKMWLFDCCYQNPIPGSNAIADNRQCSRAGTAGTADSATNKTAASRLLPTNDVTCGIAGSTHALVLQVLLTLVTNKIAAARLFPTVM
jgi:hypothetical protein